MKSLKLFKLGMTAALVASIVTVVLYYSIDNIVKNTDQYALTEKLNNILGQLSEEGIRQTIVAQQWAKKNEYRLLLNNNTRSNRRRVFEAANYKLQNIDFIAIFDNSQNIVLSRSYDQKASGFKRLDQKLAFVLKKKQFNDLLSKNETLTGYILSNELKLTTITPIILDDLNQNQLGYLVIGKNINLDNITVDGENDISFEEVNITKYPAQIHSLTEFKQNKYVNQRQQKLLQSSVLISDMFNQPAVILTAAKPVQTIEVSIKNAWQSIIAICLLLVALVYMYWRYRKKGISSNIGQLAADIQNVRIGAELSGRLSNENRSVLAPIVNAINQKIGGFEKSIDNIHAISRQHDAEIVLNELPFEAYLKDADLKYVTVNLRYCEAHNIEREDILGKTDDELPFVDRTQNAVEKERLVISNKEPLVFECEVESEENGKQTFTTHLMPFITERGRVEGVVGVRLDISAHKKAEAEMEMASKVLENTAEGVMVTDADSRIIHVNAAYSELTGYQEEELVGRIPLLLQKESRSKIYQGIQKSLEEEGSWKGELWSSRKNGTNYPEMVSIKAIRNKHGEISNYFSMSNDITERKKWEEQLYHMAHYDALTDLPNRTLFKDRLKQEIIRSQRNKKHFGVLFLDLDLFKSINDSLGHAAGDELLKVIGNRLKGTLRNADSIARLGGDEFTIMVTDLASDYEKNINYLTQLSDKIIEVIKKPIEIGSREINATASVGVTIYPVDATNVEDLLRNADSAMYYAKSQGRRNYQFYSKEFNEKAVDRLEKEIEFRAALKNGALQVFYQPQVDVISRHVVGAEALLRWRKDGETILGPDKIIALAEETGLIYELGNWILKTACTECRRWQNLGHKNIRVAVNLSTRQFRQKNLVEIVCGILEETSLSGKLLELEVTESALMENIEYSVEMMAELSRKGVRWSLDDFGTGYSSLTYLRDFPVHVLKVDQSFVKEMTINPEDSAIVETIIDLAHRLHLTVIAEGVETKEQLVVLSKMNCEQIQGYYFSQPMTADNFVEYVSKGVRV